MMWVEMEIAPFHRHYISLGRAWACYTPREEFVSSDQPLRDRQGTAQTRARSK